MVRFAFKAALFAGATAATAAAVLIRCPSLTEREFKYMPCHSGHAPLSRVATIGSLRTKELDVLVIGGGATGSGVALDAATRGLCVGLVEAHDFASGTSSKSTKLLHGGVRYLEKAVFGLDPGQLKLVFEALRERSILLHQAPHLCTPLPTMLPCYEAWEVPWYWMGLKAYDFLAILGQGMIMRSKFYPANESLHHFPALAKKKDGKTLCGSIVYYEGQMNDARLNSAVALTAAQNGAYILNHCRVESFIRDGLTDEPCGANVRDTITGEQFQIRAKVIVNATGPFTDAIRKMVNPNAKSVVVPSAGVHVTLPSYYASETHGMIIPKTKDGRVVFMLPWQGRVIAGTTDTKVEVSEDPTTPEESVEFILDSLQDFLEIPVRRQDVASVWCGIRPLAVDPNAKDTQNVLREHAVFVENGIVNVTGGKWTTYRKMSEDVVDAVLKFGKGLPNAKACRTEHVQLVGAPGFSSTTLPRMRQLFPDLDHEAVEHVVRNYGDRAKTILRLAHTTPAMAQRLVPGLPTIEAELIYQLRHEYVETIVDFISHRTRLSFLDAEGTKKAIPRVAEMMRKERKWTKERTEKELKQAFTHIDNFFAKE